MEIKPLAQMLEDLLYEASDEGLEVCLAEAECVDGENWDSVRQEYQQRYQRAVDSITEMRGSPSFAGTELTPYFPSWLEAEQATCWSDAAGIVYVALREGIATIAMIGGGHPHPIKREAITLLPPSD